MRRSSELIEVGHAIRRQRHALDLSQEELAFNCGLHRTYVGSVERGERNISIINLVKIARTLNSTASTLLANAGL